MSELEKWAKIKDEATIIFDFLDYLSSTEVSLQKYGNNDNLIPLVSSEFGDLVCRCYGIDSVKLETERQELLESTQK